jgi:hypothetical protein
LVWGNRQEKRNRSHKEETIQMSLPEVETSKQVRFLVSADELEKIYVQGREEGNANALRDIGWGTGACEKLDSDPIRGINGSPQDLIQRREVFGENKFKAEDLESRGNRTN